jgi:bifunctional ADP-heptose synthase (sugar kinase/adenylyltransferase)
VHANAGLLLSGLDEHKEVFGRLAALSAMLARGMSPRHALPIANRAGGIVVGKFGTATVSCEELFG